MRLVEDFARDGQTTQLTERCERAQHELTELLARLPQSSCDALLNKQTNRSKQVRLIHRSMIAEKLVGPIAIRSFA